MLILFLSILILLFLGMPIAFALGLGSCFSLLSDNTLPMVLVPQRMFTALDSWPIMAIPLFMLKVYAEKAKIVLGIEKSSLARKLRWFYSRRKRKKVAGKDL